MLVKKEQGGTTERKNPLLHLPATPEFARDIDQKRSMLGTVKATEMPDAQFMESRRSIRRAPRGTITASSPFLPLFHD
jgi:hypothetical protein